MGITRSIHRLVVLGDTITALAIVRECRTVGLPSVLIANRPGPATFSNIPRVISLQAVSNEELLEVVLRQAGEEGTALIADSDSWLSWIISHRSTLQSKFAAILHPSNEVLELCLNKSSFLRWCAARKLPAPKLYEDSHILGQIDAGMPVIVRPELTRHGKADGLPKAKEITSTAELSQLLDRYKQCGAVATICESLVRPSIRQYSVAIVRSDVGETRVFVAEKVRPSAEKCGGGTYVVASPDSGVEKLACEAAVAIDLYGIAEIEILKDEDTARLYLIEINPRPWVQYALASKSGFRCLTFLLDRSQYKESKERNTGKRWRKVSAMIFTSFFHARKECSQVTSWALVNICRR